MARHHFIRSTGSIAESFSQVPVNYRHFLRRGYEVAGRVDPALHGALLQIAASSYEEGGAFGTPENAELGIKLGVDPEFVPALLASTTTLLVAVAQMRRGAAEFVEAAVASEIIPVASRDAIHRLATRAESDRATSRIALQRADLRKEVLPSLSVLETSVDLRLGFTDSRIELAVPVVVVHIDTDAMTQELWFQMSKGQLEALITHLTRLKDEVAQAEQLFKDRT